jgi:cadherin EGF LAG seven-pass G-type receptor 1
LKAFDADDGVNAAVRYSVRGLDANAPFGIDSESGAITTNRDLDREETDVYQFTVVAVDGGTPALSASASVRITVQDQNDNDPVFDRKVYEGRVSESDPPGTPVATVTATDPDTGSRLHYAITGGNSRNRFSITTQNGQGLVSVAQPLDYRQENRSVPSLDYRCEDGTVKASNFGPSGNFGLFLASSVPSVDESCTKNKQNRICRSKGFLQLLFSSFFL